MSEPDASSTHGRGIGSVVAVFALAYAMMAGLLAVLVHHTGIWNLLANTRLLDLLIEGGVVRYHDLHMGVVDGIPTPKTYLMSQDPIDYRLLFLAIAMYGLFWVLKAWRFHAAGRAAGLTGTHGAHARAFFYGRGLDTFLPFRFGERATTTALAKQGETKAAAQRTFAIVEAATILFQIGVFWVIVLLTSGFGEWFAESFNALLIAIAAWLIARGTGLLPWGGQRLITMVRDSVARLRETPGALLRVGLLSVLVMAVHDIAPFLIAMAFTGDVVIMNIPLTAITGAVVAGYIATRVPLTPGGFGQWELAFALALYGAGVGFPEAGTLALMESFLRHGTGFIAFAVVRWRYGVETTIAASMQDYIAPEEPSSTGANEVTA